MLRARVGGTDSLSLGIKLETSAPPTFGFGHPLVLPTANSQPPLFMEAEGQHFQIVTY